MSSALIGACPHQDTDKKRTASVIHRSVRCASRGIIQQIEPLVGDYANDVDGARRLPA